MTTAQSNRDQYILLAFRQLIRYLQAMLLKSRFYLPPSRPQDVIRTSLITRLDRCQGGEVILITAPAGYGKTTLASQWLQQRQVSYSWISLDESHSIPITFWQYVAKALNNIQPEVGLHALRLADSLAAGQFNPEDEASLNELVVSLLNDLEDLSIRNRSNQAVTLVLDDFHKAAPADSSSLKNTFNLFLDHLPATLRVVITTRESPAINLSRRRMSRQLTELNTADLMFSESECQDFFQRNSAIQLRPEQIDALRASSEGWVAGLQLIALSMTQGSNPPLPLQADQVPHLDRTVSEYLLEQVFSLQTGEIRRFLILTACTSKFCAALANRIVGIDNGYELIRHLERLNLFVIPLDTHRTWYRYHDLFRRYLLDHFSQLNSTERHRSVCAADDWIRTGGYTDLVVINPDDVSTVEPAAPGNRMESDQPESPVEPLTKRETQVMALMAEGLANKQIADQLNISLNTLKVHIRNLYGKIGVENRSQALVKLAKPSAN